MKVDYTTFEDIDAIQSNQYYKDAKELLKQSLPYQEVFTFKDKQIRAIAMFFEFYPSCYKCGIILAKDINPHFLRFFRAWMKYKIKEHNCIRLETEGYSDKTLERFHRFLGFKKEVEINNGGYIKWVM